MLTCGHGGIIEAVYMPICVQCGIEAVSIYRLVCGDYKSSCPQLQFLTEHKLACK